MHIYIMVNESETCNKMDRENDKKEYKLLSVQKVVVERMMPLRIREGKVKKSFSLIIEELMDFYDEHKDKVN